MVITGTVIVGVPGRRQHDYIVFNVTQVIEHRSTMNQLADWSVAGQLTKVGDHLVYSGIVSSSQPGFLKFKMSPATSAAPSATSQYPPLYTQC